MDTLSSDTYSLFAAGRTYRPSDNNAMRLMIVNRINSNSGASGTNASPNMSADPSTTNPWRFVIERNGNSLTASLYTSTGALNRTQTITDNTGINNKGSDGTLYVGMFVTDNAGSGTAQYRNFKVNGELVSLNQAQILNP